MIPPESVVLLDISILPLREEWDNFLPGCLSTHRYFNPPTPRGVGLSPCTMISFPLLFQSSHSARSGTSGIPLASADFRYFNPPTPRGVGLFCQQNGQNPNHFNPPTPRGVGLGKDTFGKDRLLFQSSHSARSGTPIPYEGNMALEFQSSHSARSGTIPPVGHFKS